MIGISRQFALSIIAVLGLALASLAQTPTAQITGRIKDSSGGVIPGAQVTVINTGTQVKRETAANEEGYYVVPFLQPGSYRILVGHEGFRPVTREGVVLTVEQVARIDFELNVGAVTETVEVTASAPLLERETSTIGTLVDTRRVEELPLNGRNAYALVALIPGARVPVSWNSLPVDFATTSRAVVNGNRGNQNEYLLDGVPNTNPRNGGPGVFPNPDSVQEFRVQTNSYNAEYGRASGGVFNVVTKSGTNNLHGSVWEFHRNENVNANDFFSNRAGRRKPAFTFNQFGASLGGPIRRNRTFFFGSWEAVRQRQGMVFTGHVPTAAERAGDFSGIRNSAGQAITIYDPLTSRREPGISGVIRDPFPANRLPANRLNKVALALQEFLPEPNTAGAQFTGANNFFSANPQEINKDVFMAKADHQVSDRHRITGSFHFDRSPWVRPNAYGNIGTPTRGPQLFQRRGIVLDDVYIWNPTTILNFRYGLSRSTNDRTPYSYGFDITELGFPASYALGTRVPVVPQVSVTGFSTAYSAGNVGNGSLIGSGDLIASAFDTHSLNVSLTMVRGRHSLKTGFESRLIRLNQLLVTEKSFSFGAGFTQGPDAARATATGGYGYATFLLGIAGGTTTFAPSVAAQSVYYGGYFQDAFKVTPKLTLNLGLRYEYQAPRTDRFDQFTNFDFDGAVPLSTPGLALRGVLVFPGTGGLPRGQTDPDRNNWAPRAGFSFELTPKTVLRGGAGLFYTVTHLTTEGSGTSGFSSTTSVVTSLDGFTPVTYIDNPYPDGLVYPTGSALGPSTLLGQNVSFLQRGAVNPYALQWNFNIQRELPGSIVFDVAYLGNRGVKLEASRQYNQLPDAALELGDDLRTLVPNPFFGQITQGALARPTVTRAQLLRPFPHFTGVTDSSVGYGNSIYHALQVKVEKRFSRGMTFLASYAFSKLIDDMGGTGSWSGEALGGAGVQNWNNLRGERSVSPYDQPQSLVFSYIWELPFGPGARFLSQARGVTARLVEGWQIQGVTSLQSGSPLGVSVQTNTTFSQGGGQRADWTGRSANLGSARTINRWFDTSQFSQPQPYTFGNGPRSMGDLRADGTKNFDFTIAKSIRVKEAHRLQFRSEFFNLFNTPRFSIPGQAFGPTFGVVSTQLNSPRVIQLALKYLF